MLSSLQTSIAKSENPLHVGKGSDPDFAVTRGAKSRIWVQTKSASHHSRSEMGQIRISRLLGGPKVESGCKLRVLRTNLRTNV